MKTKSRIVILCLQIILLGLVLFVSGCSSIKPSLLYPIYDTSYTINHRGEFGGYYGNQNITDPYILKRTDIFDIKLSLFNVEEENLILAKVIIKNYLTDKQLSFALKDFTLKDKEWVIQPQISYEEVVALVKAKYSAIASKEIPSPNKQIVVEGGTTNAAFINKSNYLSSSDSNYKIKQEDEPISAFASSLAKGLQSSQLNEIENFVKTIIRNTLPNTIIVDPESAISGYMFFQKKTADYPYTLTLKTSNESFKFNFTNTPDEIKPKSNP